jgi:hypothetical protein
MRVCGYLGMWVSRYADRLANAHMHIAETYTFTYAYTYKYTYSGYRVRTVNCS